MASVINTNTLSMVTQQNLNQSQNALNTSMERLSSGLRINSAKDDAAGQAIANRMDSQITGLSQAQRNANDGISVAQTAEGALNQVNDNLQRVRELTVQAANGTNNADDLSSIQDEITMRLDEIDRISEETSFNGIDVLKSDDALSIQVGAEDGQTIEIDLQKVNSETLGLDSLRVADGIDSSKVDTTETADGANVNAGSKLTLNVATDTNSAQTSEGVYQYTDGTGYAVKASDGKYYGATIDASGGVAWDSSTTEIDTSSTSLNTDEEITTIKSEISVDTSALKSGQTLNDYKDTADGSPDYVITDTNEAGNTKYYEANIDSSTGVVTVGKELSTDSKTVDPLSAIDDALKQVDSMRSDLGAVQNRFDSAITNLATTETNLASAQSRIQDADYAEEVSSMTTAQILQQAGTSMLTQANQVPQSVLSLLG
ncbi:FliC/FljB family flagellin [Cobetia sp. SIMBA_158]|uniref:FliC/FljB family flagellin n=1 Tax=Cobetia sp. SIMBA_158 TaxID=3081617 RepID=UPI00397F880E